MNAKQYLDDIIPRLESGQGGKPPDCWIVYRTVPHNTPTGEPLAIYKLKKSLYKNLTRLDDANPSQYGITVGAWWFDDQANAPGERPGASTRKETNAN